MKNSFRFRKIFTLTSIVRFPLVLDELFGILTSSNMSCKSNELCDKVAILILNRKKWSVLTGICFLYCSTTERVRIKLTIPMYRSGLVNSFFLGMCDYVPWHIRNNVFTRPQPVKNFNQQLHFLSVRCVRITTRNKKRELTYCSWKTFLEFFPFLWIIDQYECYRLER